MGSLGNVATILVVGGIGLYLLYAFNNGQLQIPGVTPSGDTTNITNEIPPPEDSSDTTSGSLCSDPNTMGCCTDNAGNTCWRGTTTGGIKVGGCQSDSDCNSARDDFIDQFGEDDDDEDNKNKNKKSKSKPANVIDPNPPPARPPGYTGSKSACEQFTGATRDACLKSRYASAYLGSAFNRRGPSYNYRDDFPDPEHMEFPDRDWYGEASKHPYYLGDVSLERDMLLKRFNSNFGSMRFSG